MKKKKLKGFMFSIGSAMENKKSDGKEMGRGKENQAFGSGRNIGVGNASMVYETRVGKRMRQCLGEASFLNNIEDLQSRWSIILLKVILLK